MDLKDQACKKYFKIHFLMQDPSIKYILKLSIPIFFANLAIPMVGIIDTALMGNLGNLSYLSATSVAANLFSMIFWSFGFLRMGTVGMVSQANGKENYEEIINIVLRNLLFVLIISMILIAVQNYILYLSLQVFELSESTQELYKEYFNIRIYSAPGELTLYIITGLYIGLQKTKTSSVIVGLFSLSNILISLILVVKFDLNVKGVALGTLISAYLTSIIAIIYSFFNLSKISNNKINLKNLINLKKLKTIFDININIFIRTVLLTFSFLWFTYQGNKISEEIIAANAILVNLVFLSAFILDAYAFSTEGVVGYSLGKKNKKMFNDVVKNSFILSATTGLVISFIYFLSKTQIIDLMTSLENIRQLTYTFSVWLIIFPFLSSFCYQFDGIFIGASQTKELRNAMILSVIIYILLSIYLTGLLGNHGLWMSLTLFMIFRAITLYFFLNKIYQRFN